MKGKLRPGSAVSRLRRPISEILGGNRSAAHLLLFAIVCAGLLHSFSAASAWAHRAGSSSAWSHSESSLSGMSLWADESLSKARFASDRGPIAFVRPHAVDDSVRSSFEKVILVEHTTRPNELEVAPDGRVFFIEREGAVRVWHPETETTAMAGFIPVEAVHTSGLLGMALDPNFENNGWMYLYYSPLWNNAINELARYTIVDSRIDLESKRVLLEIPVDRYVDQAHSAGSIEFGPDGNLFLSTGDNTNPTEVQYFSSIDERPGRELWDVQRASSNTNDLRGKILRIRPTPDGSYTIPEGNLFEGDSLHRPEIYTMGHRNPYRISIDPETGWLYWGDVGPGAGAASEARGPKGFDEFNQAREPGFFGWPYFVADNKAYREYDFATGESGPYYDAKAPINNSPNNTGARVLPPARPAMIWYPHGPSDEFPVLGVGGQAAMAGPVYRYDAATKHEHALPASYDGTLLAFDFMRNWIMEVTFDESGDLAEITPFAPGMEFVRPFDIDIGPDGRVYLIEWGTNYEGWYNENARIVRLDYYGSKPRPADAEGFSASATTPDPAGNTAPSVHFTAPVHGGFFEYDTPVEYRISATNAGENSASDGLILQPLLVHDSHTHEFAPKRGRTGAIRVSRDITHVYLEDERLVLEARYTDRGAGGTDTLTTSSRVVLHPRRIEAEHANSVHESDRDITGDNVGGSVLRVRREINIAHMLSDGSYLSFAPINLLNVASLTFRTAPVNGGTLEVRLDSPNGPVLQSIDLTPSSPSGTHEEVEQDDKTIKWTEITAPVKDPVGVHELFLVARGASGGTLMQLDWIQFNGTGGR